MKIKCFESMNLSDSTLFGFEFSNDNIGLLLQQSTGEFQCLDILGVTQFNLSQGANGINVFVTEGSDYNKYSIEDQSGQPFLQVSAKSIELNGQV